MALADVPPSSSSPSPSSSQCGDCGAESELLTRVRLPAGNGASARDDLLCPNCLTDRVVAQRSQGGRLEVYVGDDRVVLL